MPVMGQGVHSRNGYGQSNTFAYNKLVFRALMVRKGVIGLDNGTAGIASVQVAVWVSRRRREDAVGSLISNHAPVVRRHAGRASLTTWRVSLIWGKYRGGAS